MYRGNLRLGVGPKPEALLLKDVPNLAQGIHLEQAVSSRDHRMDLSDKYRYCQRNNRPRSIPVKRAFQNSV